MDFCTVEITAIQIVRETPEQPFFVDNHAVRELKPPRMDNLDIAVDCLANAFVRGPVKASDAHCVAGRDNKSFHDLLLFLAREAIVNLPCVFRFDAAVAADISAETVFVHRFAFFSAARAAGIARLFHVLDNRIIGDVIPHLALPPSLQDRLGQCL